MNDVEQQQQIAADVADIKALLTAQSGRLDVLEDWRAEHQAWAERQSLEISQRIERQSVEVLRQVTGNMQAMVKDAMQSGMGELFRQLFEEMREEQREERRKEVKEMFGTLHKSTVWVQPLLQVALLILGLYAFWWR